MIVYILKTYRTHNTQGFVYELHDEDGSVGRGSSFAKSEAALALSLGARLAPSDPLDVQGTDALERLFSKLEGDRADKASLLADRVRLTYAADGIYRARVPGSSVYDVQIDTVRGRAKCTCKDREHRGLCKHQGALAHALLLRDPIAATIAA